MTKTQLIDTRKIILKNFKKTFMPKRNDSKKELEKIQYCEVCGEPSRKTSVKNVNF